MVVDVDVFLVVLESLAACFVFMVVYHVLKEYEVSGGCFMWTIFVWFHSWTWLVIVFMLKKIDYGICKENLKRKMDRRRRVTCVGSRFCGRGWRCAWKEWKYGGCVVRWSESSLCWAPRVILHHDPLFLRIYGIFMIHLGFTIFIFHKCPL